MHQIPALWLLTWEALQPQQALHASVAAMSRNSFEFAYWKLEKIYMNYGVSELRDEPESRARAWLSECFAPFAAPGRRLLFCMSPYLFRHLCMTLLMKLKNKYIYRLKQ